MEIEEVYKAKLRQIRKDVILQRARFCNTWNQELSQIFGKRINIEKQLEVEGGFWLSGDGYRGLAPELSTFFSMRALNQNGCVFLRGYDYYCNDPTMHKNQTCCRMRWLFDALIAKWEKYPKMLFTELNQSTISFEDWAGYLSFFEYCFHDLTSIRWLEFKYGEYYELSDILNEAIVETEELLDYFAAIIALLLKHRYVQAFELASINYPRFLSSPHINSFLDNVPDDLFGGNRIDIPFIRAVQEGDSLFKIYAAFRTKLLPFVRKTTWNHIMLYGNAFGAMNVGLIFKHLLCDENKQIDCGCVNYSTHRYYIDTFKEVSSKAVFVSEGTVCEDACSIIIDDTVWTASSFKKIVEDLSLKNAYLLPLSIDCNSLVHNQQLCCTVEKLYEIALFAFTLAKEIGNSYPIFFSSWDRMRAVKKYDRQTDDYSYREVLKGADLLMKHLWNLYFDDYISCESEG